MPDYRQGIEPVSEGMNERKSLSRQRERDEGTDEVVEGEERGR